MIQLTRAGAMLPAQHDEVAQLRTGFAREHCVLLPRLIEPDLLRTVQQWIDGSTFQPFIHGKIGFEENLTDPLTIHLLLFLINDPPFLQVVRDISQCPEIDVFQGRVYRMDPAIAHKDSWHDDVIHNRAVGMSVNLSRTPFEGGVFQLRDKASNQMIHEVANTGSGDAIIFRLAANLEHRNTQVTGATPKTAFAGWFRSEQPDFYSSIRSPR